MVLAFREGLFGGDGELKKKKFELDHFFLSLRAGRILQAAISLVLGAGSILPSFQLTQAELLWPLHSHICLFFQYNFPLKHSSYEH